MRLRFVVFMVFLSFASAAAAEAQVASGGPYTFEQAVVSAGGGESTGGIYKIEGTIGQSIAGTRAAGGVYSHASGFWTPAPLVPTSAGATISGSVFFEKATPLRGVTVILTGGPLTAPRVTVTNNFGRFSFTDVPVGHLYVVGVVHKKYGFGESSRAFTLHEDLTDIIFRANWEN